MRTLAAAAMLPLGATAINAVSVASRKMSRLEIVMTSPPKCEPHPGAIASEVSSPVGIHACPAHDLECRMLLRPFRDFRWSEEHALEQRAMVLEVEALGPAFGRVRREANR